MIKKMVSIVPKVDLLKSLRGEPVNYNLLVGEAIDNAFDASATSVKIVITEADITIQDDGQGVSGELILSVFTLGDHGAMRGSVLGRFGIGIKTQAACAGNMFSITSTSEDGCVMGQVHWPDVLAGGIWQMEEPSWRSRMPKSATGTMVVIGDLVTKPKLTPAWIKQLADDIAERFYPALASGRGIVLNGEPIPILQEPDMTDIVECDLLLSGGRLAHLRAGILKQLSRLHHVNVGYGHRMLMPKCALGCGQYGGLEKMFGRVQISGPKSAWHLAKFKDGLPNETERVELNDAVHEALLPILEKCHGASMTARTEEILDRLNDMLPPELATARPHHKKKSTQNTNREGRSQGVVEMNKADAADGPAKARRKPNGLLITFGGLNDECGVGRFDPGPPNPRVELSADNPIIRLYMDYRGKGVAGEIALQALYDQAINIYVDGMKQRQGELFTKGQTFGEQVARLLSLQANSKSEAAD